MSPGPSIEIPRLQQWNLSLKTRSDRDALARHGLRRISWQPPVCFRTASINRCSRARPTPLNCGYDGNPQSCITTNTSRNAKQRVPIMGETPTALLASEFGAHSWYQSLQATLRSQMSHGLSFQAAYTLSKAAQ